MTKIPSRSDYRAFNLATSAFIDMKGAIASTAAMRTRAEALREELKSLEAELDTVDTVIAEKTTVYEESVKALAAVQAGENVTVDDVLEFGRAIESIALTMIDTGFASIGSDGEPAAHAAPAGTTGRGRGRGRRKSTEVTSGAAEEPVAPPAEEPVAAGVTDAPATDASSVEEPVAPSAEKPAADATDTPAAPVEESPVEEPVALPVEEPTPVEEPADAPLAEEPAASTADASPTEEPVAPAVEESAVSVEKSPVEEPVTPVVEEPATDSVTQAQQAEMVASEGTAGLVDAGDIFSGTTPEHDGDAVNDGGNIDLNTEDQGAGMSLSDTFDADPSAAIKEPAEEQNAVAELSDAGGAEVVSEPVAAPRTTTISAPPVRRSIIPPAGVVKADQNAVQKADAAPTEQGSETAQGDNAESGAEGVGAASGTPSGVIIRPRRRVSPTMMMKR